MEALLTAFNNRNKKQNKIEKLKTLKDPQVAFNKLEQYAKDGFDSIPDEDKDYFLKCFGIYYRAKTPKQFMIKLRIPGGQLKYDQAKVIGECAKLYGNDYLDLTTRTQCELRYIDIENIPTILKKLKEVNIDPYQTGVDNIRGIMCDPFDDMAFDNILPSYKTLLKLQDKFLYNKDWISTLPRKFNTAISGKISLRDGTFGVHVVVPSRIFTGSDMLELSNLSEQFGNGQIRLDMEQSIHILCVKDVSILLNQEFFKVYKNVNTPYLNNLIACAGTEHCPFGVIENKNDAIEMSNYLGEKVHLVNTRVRIYWSACVKGCGNQQMII